ncbi:protein of unknown function [Micromonospora haikouensis]|uniref:DUF4190 domain-containing protein n=1 Tax=Micromonospora haikouensis TaxID=686309 RepID=A0A1C4X7E6_9ACTN|nr:DUF4190 domain-containing protein [Micromonospora haikouensis]SCF04382.1 protein of unknown function [Micromonospora haikouensis]
MTYPPPADSPSDPWSQPATPPVDPTLPASGPPTGGDPYAPVDPYAGMKMEQAAPVADPYAVPGYAPAGHPAPGYPGYGYAPPPRTNGMAIAALVLSLVGIGSCITAPIGAILGHVARKQIRETGEGGEGMAKAAIIVGWILTGLLVLAILFYVVLIVIAITTSDSGSGTSYGY